MIEPPTDGGPPFGSAATHRLATQDVPCLRCGYNLRGLQPHGVCPECGAPIERSLHGNLLRYSAPEYVATLHTGLLCILVAILTLVAGAMLMFTAGIAAEMFLPDEQWLLTLISNTITIGAIALSIVSVVGWWLFSTPDQAIIGHDTGDMPRKILRVTVIVSAVFITIDALGEWWLYQDMPYDVLAAISAMVGGIAWLVQFFASLLYIRWLAHRLPNPRIVSLSTTYLWLLPLIYILGFCVLFIGPLVATILYLLVLNDVRRDIRAIQRSIAAGEV
jgi:hypothetical protein